MSRDFKIGDRVRVVSEDGLHRFTKCEGVELPLEGKVVESYSAPAPGYAYVSVRLPNRDKDIIQYCRPGALELVESEDEMATIGETVESIRANYPHLCLRPNPRFSAVCIDAIGHTDSCGWEEPQRREGEALEDQLAARMRAEG